MKITFDKVKLLIDQWDYLAMNQVFGDENWFMMAWVIHVYSKKAYTYEQILRSGFEIYLPETVATIHKLL